MSEHDNVELQKRFGAAVNSGELDELNHLVSEHCVDHDPAPEQYAGPLGYIRMFRELLEAFPDLQVDVEHLVANGDDVAFAYTMTGTHRGLFMGIPGTGREIRARGMQISRFADGKMVERWGSSDQLGILQQLGADVVA